MGRVRTASKKLLSATQVPASGASLRLSAALPIARRTPPIRWGTEGSNPACSRRESRANLKTTLLGRGIAGLESPAPAGITEILRILSPKRVGVREDHQSGRGEVLGRIFLAARGVKAA